MADENETERDETESPERGGTDDAPAAAAASDTSASSTEPEAEDDEADDESSAASDDASGNDDATHEREARKEAEQLAREQENLRDDELPIAGLLGLERWVQFAFVALAVFLVFVTDKLVTFGWEFYAEPDDTLVTIIAVAVGLVGTYLAYQNDRVRDFSTEVVTELSKVTWPTREETWYSTLVVLTASAIAAVYTGVFDALWSALTDLVYRV